MIPHIRLDGPYSLVLALTGTGKHMEIKPYFAM